MKHIKVKGKKGKKGKAKETYDLIVNIDLVRFLLHSVENWEIYYHSYFTWNQFLARTLLKTKVWAYQTMNTIHKGKLAENDFT